MDKHQDRPSQKTTTWFQSIHLFQTNLPLLTKTKIGVYVISKQLARATDCLISFKNTDVKPLFTVEPRVALTDSIDPMNPAAYTD